jgi:putative SOS response-associated peptidase YedK
MPDGAGEAFRLLTTEPGPDVTPIHDRQMVVLDRPDWLAWLDLTWPGSRHGDRIGLVWRYDNDE